jgi:hypothetical protein
VISHSHLGHLAGLVFLTETLAFHGRRRAGTAPVVEGLRSSALNHVLWPDFARVPDALSPVITYRTLKADAGQRVGDLWATPAGTPGAHGPSRVRRARPRLAIRPHEPAGVTL